MGAGGVPSTPDTLGIRVTEAGDGHVDAIASFFWEAWRSSGPDAPGWAGASEEVIAELTTSEAIRERIGGPERRMFLAWEGNRVVAFAATRSEDAEAVELVGIIVLQDMMGHGIETPLLESAARWAVEAGFRRMSVKTEATNDRALGFYRSRGFIDSRMLVEDVEGTAMELSELIRTL
ncbi:GNAT family N-acetyltransferase [bacterium]|nr:GNAT family N-acetyltransferase [bacterium]